MGSQGLLLLIGLKVLIIMTSLQSIVTSGAQGLLMLMESKFLIKMTRPLKEQLIPSTSGDLEHLKDRAYVKQQMTWSIGSILYSTNSRGML